MKQIFQFVIFLLIIYIFLITNNLTLLFQSILGRLFIFLFLILITSIDKTLGFIFGAYLLVYFNNVLINNYIPNKNVENFSNIYSNKKSEKLDFDTTTNKINMESYLQPKRSNDLFPFKMTIPSNEPKPNFLGIF